MRHLTEDEEKKIRDLEGVALYKYWLDFLDENFHKMYDESSREGTDARLKALCSFWETVPNDIKTKIYDACAYVAREHPDIFKNKRR